VKSTLRSFVLPFFFSFFLASHSIILHSKLSIFFTRFLHPFFYILQYPSFPSGTLLYVLQGEDLDSGNNADFEFFGSAVPDNLTIDHTSGLIKAKIKLESTSSSRLVTLESDHFIRNLVNETLFILASSICSILFSLEVK
jgi:hypothetical protein